VSDPYRSPPAPPYRAPARGAWRCPRCEASLAGEDHAGVRLDVCSRCGGMFVGHGTLTELIERDGVIDELRALLPRAASAWAEGGRMYVSCPVCEVLMNRRQYATGAKVVIDVCKHHGLWFDAGELPRALDFVAAGGLARAAARDEADARDQARREQERREQDKLDLARTSSYTAKHAAIEAGISGLLDALLGKLR